MNGSVFAQTSPVWIGTVGSSEPVARRIAAEELLEALGVAVARVEARYGEIPVPRIRERFEAARRRLEALARSP